MDNKTQETPAISMGQMMREDSDRIYKHLPRYKCKGCGVTVVNDCWCNDCLTEMVAESDNQPPIFAGEWED